MFVENKLFSGFGYEQLGALHAGLAALPAGRRSGLMAITRDVPSYGELDAGTEGWLGAVRWARLYDAGLADLQSADPDLSLQWRLLIEMMHDNGELGVTNADRDLIMAWTRYDDARDHLVSILGDVRGRALEALRDRLHVKVPGGRGPRETSSLQPASFRPARSRTVQARRRAPWDGVPRARPHQSSDGATELLGRGCRPAGVLRRGARGEPLRASTRANGSFASLRGS